MRRYWKGGKGKRKNGVKGNGAKAIKAGTNLVGSYRRAWRGEHQSGMIHDKRGGGVGFSKPAGKMDVTGMKAGAGFRESEREREVACGEKLAL